MYIKERYEKKTLQVDQASLTEKTLLSKNVKMVLINLINLINRIQCINEKTSIALKV